MTPQCAKQKKKEKEMAACFITATCVRGGDTTTPAEYTWVSANNNTWWCQNNNKKNFMPGHLVVFSYSRLNKTTPVLARVHFKCYPSNHYSYFVVRRLLLSSLGEGSVFIRRKLKHATCDIAGILISFSACMRGSTGETPPKCESLLC